MHKKWIADVKKITHRVLADSRQVTPNAVFVALPGHKTNGHNHISTAIKKGAKALVVQQTDSFNPASFSGPVLVVKNTLDFLPLLLKEFYDHPSEKLFCLGVTGTNGKTTVSQMIAFLLSHLGWPCGLIGTINNRFKDWVQKSQLTTPDSATLYHLLNGFYQKGAKAVAIEVSSIGLDQNRTAGVDFNVGVWTNLSLDHQDYHPSMSAYFSAKKKLFNPPAIDNPLKGGHFQAVIHLDDPYGLKLAREIKVPFISYGQKQARCVYEVLSHDLSGTHFKVHFEGQTVKGFLPLPGLYNVANAVASLCAVVVAGFSLSKAIKILEDFPGVPGRLTRVCPLAPPFVFVDYAHTPSALTEVLSFLHQHKKQGCLYTVFGCGGERDKQKRPLMAKEAEKFSDRVFLTSDNPRGEDPHQIIEESLKGASQKEKFVVEADRKQAIHLALGQANKGDIVLIAGKGHENVQLLQGERLFFSDVKVVQQYYNQ